MEPASFSHFCEAFANWRREAGESIWIYFVGLIIYKDGREDSPASE
jgi:hypothetical protein